MPINASRETLLARHASISRRIELEQSRPAANDLEIRDLKRKKLKLKEQIEGLS